MWTIEVYNQRGDYLGVLSGDPMEIGEYEDYPLQLHLDSDLDARDFTLSVDGRRLKRHGDVFAFGADKSERGRIGRVAVDISFQGKHQATGYLAITRSHLSPEQYRYIIQDLKRLISLASQDETAVRSNEESWQYVFVEFYDRRLQAIGAYIEQLKSDIAAVERAPHRTVGKQYDMEREERARRIDARTIRWQAIHGDSRDGKILTYTHVERYDLYENRFVIHIFDWLLRYLDDLPKRFAHVLTQRNEETTRRITDLRNAPVMSGEEGARERQAFREAQISQLVQMSLAFIRIQGEQLPQYRTVATNYTYEVQKLRRRPFLAGVTSDPSFRVSPTLVLLRDPAYNATYEHYIAVRHDVQADEQQRFEAMLDHVPIERTSKLYEYWVLLQVYQELRRLGFAPESQSAGIESMIDWRSFRFCPGSRLLLIGDSEIYGFAGGVVRVELSYEPRIGGNTGGLCPDIMVEFIYGDNRYILIIDAKYRDYDAPGCWPYEADVEDVAHQKYLRLQRRSERDGPWIELEGVDELRQAIRAAFIVHSHDDERRFRDYGSAGHRNQYGAIPLVPDSHALHVVNLRRLFTMFMRMHLGIHDVCWSDAHQTPVIARKVRPIGGNSRKEWEAEYHCEVCHNRWWVNHCGRWCQGDSINVIKITFSDPSDNFFDVDPRNQRLKCASCDHSYEHSRR